MVIRIKRLFHGFASVRDYQVSTCVRTQKNLRIEYNGEAMVIPWNKLSEGFTNSEVFKSKHSNRSYSLVDYDWKPTKQQMTLL